MFIEILSSILYVAVWRQTLSWPKRKNCFCFFTRITLSFASLISQPPPLTCRHSSLSPPSLILDESLGRHWLSYFSFILSMPPSLLVDLSQLHNLSLTFLFNQVINTKFHLDSSVPNIAWESLHCFTSHCLLDIQKFGIGCSYCILKWFSKSLRQRVASFWSSYF